MRVAVLALCVPLLWPAAAFATTYLVRPDGTGDYPTIQAAINAAANGDTVALTDGTFTGDGNRDIGYLGKAITVRSQSGNAAACVIDCEATQWDLHRGFSFHAGEGSGSILDGIKIINGVQYHGGGVLCQGTSPSIGDCILEANTANNDRGGGLYCSGDSSPRLVGCRFVGNVAVQHGGGALGLMSGGSVSVTDCVFTKNTGPRGGAIYCWGGTPTFTRCIFTENHAGDLGGALHYQSGSRPTVTDCQFVANSAHDGGAVFAWDELSAEIADCIFVGNRATDGGGGVKCYMGAPTVGGCSFSGNQADEGGGLIAYMSDADVSDCVFRQNAATRGGGMLCWGHPSHVNQCTFWGNRAEAGGALLAEYATPWLGNCTFSGDSAASGAEIWSSYDSQVQLVNTIVSHGVVGEGVGCSEGSTATLTCCDVFGNAGGDWAGCIADQVGVNGNFSLDPFFCAAGSGDYRLWNYSPCDQEGCGLIGAWPVGCEDPQAVSGEVVASGARLWTVPNPFAGGTTIAYRLGPGSSADGVSVAIYDVAGRLVRTLRAQSVKGGTAQLRWDGTDDAGRALPGGMYVLRMAGDGRTVTERIIKIR